MYNNGKGMGMSVTKMKREICCRNLPSTVGISPPICVYLSNHQTFMTHNSRQKLTEVARQVLLWAHRTLPSLLTPLCVFHIAIHATLDPAQTLCSANSINAASHGVTKRCVESLVVAPKSFDLTMRYALLCVCVYVRRMY